MYLTFSTSSPSPPPPKAQLSEVNKQLSLLNKNAELLDIINVQTKEIIKILKPTTPKVDFKHVLEMELGKIVSMNLILLTSTDLT